MFFGKKQTLESKEYEKVLARIGEMNAEISMLHGKLNSQDSKLDDLKVLIAKTRREANKILKDEDTESVNNDDGFNFFRV